MSGAPVIRRRRTLALLKAIQDVMSRMRFDDGRLLVRALVENAELTVALSALNDSVLIYGMDYDSNTVRPAAVDERGRLLVALDAALTATRDSVEVYGRDYESGAVRPIAVDSSGWVISRPPSSVETVLDDVVNVNPVETPPIDCRAFGRKVVYIANSQDVPVRVSFYASPDSVSWFPIVENEVIDPDTSRYGVLSEYHPFMKLRLVAESTPSRGRVTVWIAKYGA